MLLLCVLLFQDVDRVYLPHVASAWKNRLLVDNLAGTPGSFSLVLFDENGTKVYEGEHQVTGHGFSVLNPSQLAATSACGWIETTLPSLRFRMTYIEPSQGGAAEFLLSGETGNSLSFNLGIYNPEDLPLTWKGIALFNSGETTTRAQLYALDDTGHILGEGQIEVAARARVRGLVETYFSGVLYQEVARIVALADQPLAGLNISGVEGRQLLFGPALIGGSIPNPIPTGNLPQQLPELRTLNLYNQTSPLNQIIPEDAEIDENNALYQQGFQASGGFLVQVGQYSAPVYFADQHTPRERVTLPCGDFWELGVNQLVNVPVPSWAVPAFDSDGASNPPQGCGEESDQDNMMVIYDLTNRCEYNFWQARKVNGTWSASWATAVSMDGTGILEHGLSARGSGFAFSAGLLWPDEVRENRISHALVFSYPFTKSGGPVSPATDSDGSSEASFALPEGARIQLDPALDLNGLPLTPYERAIAEALQIYGMFLVDNGGETGIGLYAVDPKSAADGVWQGIFPEGDYVPLPNIPLDKLRVLALPDQDSDWFESLGLPMDGCADYR